MHYLGLTIHTNTELTLPAEDWSRVRSPSRAVRRLRRGFRQNIRQYKKPDPSIYRIGDVYVCHPVTMHAIQQAAQADAAFVRAH